VNLCIALYEQTFSYQKQEKKVSIIKSEVLALFWILLINWFFWTSYNFSYQKRSI